MFHSNISIKGQGDLETVLQSEESQRKPNNINSYMWNLEKKKKGGTDDVNYKPEIETQMK